MRRPLLLATALAALLLFPAASAAKGPSVASVTGPGGPNGDSSLRQDLYPYAAKGPVTYMAPDQKFWGRQYTPGGWSRGTIQLRNALVKAGLPSRAPGNEARAQRKI